MSDRPDDVNPLPDDNQVPDREDEIPEEEDEDEELPGNVNSPPDSAP